MQQPDYQYDDVKICVIQGEEPHPADFPAGTTLFFYPEPTNPYDDRAVRIENANGVKAGYFYRGKLQDMANDFLSEGGKLVGMIQSYDGVTMMARIAFFRDGRDAVQFRAPSPVSAPAAQPTVININNTATATATGVDPFVSPKKKWVAFWLCFFGGFFGLHRFYVGKFGSGIAYLFTGGIIGIGYFIDLFKILTNSFRDRDGRRLQH